MTCLFSQPTGAAALQPKLDSSYTQLLLVYLQLQESFQQASDQAWILEMERHKDAVIPTGYVHPFSPQSQAMLVHTWKHHYTGTTLWAFLECYYRSAGQIRERSTDVLHRGYPGPTFDDSGLWWHQELCTHVFVMCHDSMGLKGFWNQSGSVESASSISWWKRRQS